MQFFFLGIFLIFIIMASYKKYMYRAMEWAYNEGYKDIDINHIGISYIKWSDNLPDKIRIEGRYPLETRVYLFLHELGHHQLRKDWSKFEKMFPILAYAEESDDRKYTRRIEYYVSSMEEEFMAWSEGHKLGLSLGIKINANEWDKIRNTCLIGYMRYWGDKK
jgi:hypothetical protein